MKKYLIILLLILPFTLKSQNVLRITQNGKIVKFQNGNTSVNNLIFQSGNFDFNNNVWLDASGYNNNATMVNAYARTGAGGNLDYTITGLLTSDVVTVESGSDIPTIPTNGTLRIGPTDIVYGVTIKRSDTIWAIIPFCEMKICDENIPTISYDVSGWGNHATASGLADSNIVKQSNYFYLAEYGYSAHGNNVLSAIDFTSWTGTFPDERAAGFTYVDATDANQYTSDAGNGHMLYSRTTSAPTSSFRLNVLGAWTVGKRYITEVNVIDFNLTNTTVEGLIIAGAGFYTPYQIRTTGRWYNEYVPVSTTFQLNRQYGSITMDFTIDEPKSYLKIIVPGLISKNGKDALGNDLEFNQPGNRWLRYACDLVFPNNVANNSKNYGCGDLIKSGYLSPLYKYEIIKTTTDYFGAGKITGDTIQGDSTILCQYNYNWVRKIYDDSLFSDTVRYDSLDLYRRGLYYTDKKYKQFNNYVEETTSAETELRGSWNQNIDSGYVSMFNVPLASVDIHDQYKSIYPQHLTNSAIAFIWDKINDMQIDTMEAYADTSGIKYTYAINYGNRLSPDTLISLINRGHEIAHHTVVLPNGSYLPSYKQYYETGVNYTRAELNTYYQDVINYYDTCSYSYPVTNDIFPGGAHDTLNISLVLDYFHTGTTVSPSRIHQIPLFTTAKYYYKIDEYATDFNQIALLSRQGIANKLPSQIGFERMDTIPSIKILYAHPDYDFPVDYGGGVTGWDNFRNMLNYLISLQKKGNEVRIYTMEDLYQLINNNL